MRADPELGALIMENHAAFMAAAEPSDDITLVVVKVL